MNALSRIRCAVRNTLLLTGATLAMAASPAWAQGFPTKPVRLLVSAPAGGTSDMVARMVAEGLAPLLGQPMVVENKPGGLGAIAMQDLLSSPHDGHTLIVAPNALVSEVPHTLKPKYDPFKDITPLAELARSGLVLVGNPSLPARNLIELMAHVKANPGKISYASYSAGTMSHVMGMQMNKVAGLEMSHVGYKGSPPALVDVMGGHVPLMFDGVATSLPMIRSGKLRAYAVSAPKRLSVLPEVPTFTELGFPQLEAIGWIGMFAASDVPAAAQQKLREATLKVLQQPQLRERLKELGQDAGQPLTSEQLAAGLRKDSERVGEVLRSVNYQPE
ncbi:Bug family tripartite tricarboxylate transporter substrate binding protein [Variovorax saccharolyticus]|uniref:Bug family tripartite tricarboxylate transporter substrate binding protein n=1 Tax=Variovorax saccharolyticus TaxID=3053516 RepID=UPI0025755B57|nr:tripartite tricarboxylate transporter substrate binding protein [Variovorax sp. J31P216]MDM0028287.1 tripartite tricarboxylate transporter substrate binding protein [Variovorax sp. J31P216]